MYKTRGQGERRPPAASSCLEKETKMETVRCTLAEKKRNEGTIPASIARAQKIQETLRRQCSVRPVPDLSAVRTIAGADAAYDGNSVYSAVVLMTFPGLSEIRSVVSRSEASFPYIAGYFAFREGPGLIEAVDRLPEKPGVLLINGHGIAHPRRFGLASHVGVLLDIPVIGVAGRLMKGNYTFPRGRDGLEFPVYMGDEHVATGVRKKPGSRPVYISPGHGVTVDQSVEIVTLAAGCHRLPEPLWRAHMLAGTSVRESKAE